MAKRNQCHTNYNNYRSRGICVPIEISILYCCILGKLALPILLTFHDISCDSIHRLAHFDINNALPTHWLLISVSNVFCNWCELIYCIFHCNFCSPNWIKIHGEEYHFGDYILIGRQPDDLPVFAKITDLMVIVDYPVSEVNICRTVGLVNHLMSYMIVPSLQLHCVSLINLVECHPYSAHTFDDGGLYITLRSRVEAELLTTIQ